MAFLIGGVDNNKKQDAFKADLSAILYDPNMHLLNRENGKIKNVPIAQNDYWCRIDVAKGTLDFTDITLDLDGDLVTDYTFNLLDGTHSTDYVFPICLENNADYDGDGVNDHLYGWALAAIVYGSYHPVDLLSYLDISQKKDGIYGPVARIDIIWELDTTYSPTKCGEERWIARFEAEDPCILLESNHAPDCSLPNLGKWVNVEFSSTWAGCGQLIQQFVYILVHQI
ncbi:MAG: hypothetical protein ACFFCY_13070 [Promethearchaeota archaeon]